MKKFFTLLLMSVMTLTAVASINIYVKKTSDTAPYLYAWNGASNGDWPGTQMTETENVQGTNFWKKTFDASGFSIIINTGNGGKQTSDINGVISDRFFEFDEATGKYTDVTEQYGGEIPDATITSLLLAGNHTTPAWGDGAQAFTAVQDGTKYTITVDLTGKTIAAGTDAEGFWRFKLIANGGTWFGYNAVTFDSQPSWLQQAIADDNFEIDMEAPGLNGQVFTLTATWGGGKQAGENWTLKVENNAGSGIGVTTMEKKGNGETFNLQGQRVGNSYRGIVVEGGKKFLNK